MRSEVTGTPDLDERARACCELLHTVVAGLVVCAKLCKVKMEHRDVYSARAEWHVRCRRVRGLITVLTVTTPDARRSPVGPAIVSGTSYAACELSKRRTVPFI